jgi:hypothetical protein
MGAKRLRRLLVGLLAALVLAPCVPASAERIGSRAEDATASRETDLTHVRDVLAREAVAKALAAHGLPPGDVEQRLAGLSDEDLRRLAGNLDQIQAAGNVPEYIWILLAVFLAVSILAMIL